MASLNKLKIRPILHVSPSAHLRLESHKHLRHLMASNAHTIFTAGNPEVKNLGPGRRLDGVVEPPTTEDVAESEAQQATGHTHIGNNLKSQVLLGNAEQTVGGDVAFGSPAPAAPTSNAKREVAPLSRSRGPAPPVYPDRKPKLEPPRSTSSQAPQATHNTKKTKKAQPGSTHTGDNVHSQWLAQGVKQNIGGNLVFN